MSAAVTSASVKLPNGVLVSIGDSPGSVENMYKELVRLLGSDEDARAFMSRVRAAFLSETEVYTPPARGGGGNRNWGGNQRSNAPQQQQESRSPSWGRATAAAPAAANGHYCNHGEMIHKAFVSQKGNNVELWECRAGQCETQWPPRS